MKYDIIQEFIITQWGRLLYLDWETLPTTGNTNKLKLIPHIQYFHDITTKEDEEAIEEFEEWVAEGMYVNNYPLLTLQLFNEIMTSCQVPLENEIEVYRYSDDHILKPNKWISMTTIKDNSPYSGKMIEYTLMPGILIIDAHGLADDNEIIINTNELLK